jgi:hypothetical protein
MKARRQIIISGYAGEVFTVDEAAQLLASNPRQIKKAVRIGQSVRGHVVANVHDRLPQGWMDRSGPCIIIEGYDQAFTTAQAAELLNTKRCRVNGEAHRAGSINGRRIANLRDRHTPAWKNLPYLERRDPRAHHGPQATLDFKLPSGKKLGSIIADRRAIDPARAAAALELVERILAGLSSHDARCLGDYLAMGCEGSLPDDLLERCRGAIDTAEAR